jgi:hypothetical protein
MERGRKCSKVCLLSTCGYLFVLVLIQIVMGRQTACMLTWATADPLMRAAIQANATLSSDGGAAFGSASADFIPSTITAIAPSDAVLAEAATPTAPVSGAAASTLGTRRWDFDQDRPGRTAAGWTSVVGSWTVIPDPTAPTPPHTFGLSSGRFFSSLVRLSSFYPMAIAMDSPQYRNFTLEAWFKAVGGRLNCSGGLIFAYQNPKNYYVMEAGCPSDYFSVSRVSRERFTLLAQSVVPIVLDHWYKLRIDAAGPRMTCYVDGRVIFRVNDAQLRPGKVGLWARADAQVRFDNVILEPLTPK